MKYAVKCSVDTAKTLARLLAVSSIPANYVKTPGKSVLVLLQTEAQRIEATRLLSLISSTY